MTRAGAGFVMLPSSVLATPTRNMDERASRLGRRNCVKTTHSLNRRPDDELRSYERRFRNPADGLPGARYLEHIRHVRAREGHVGHRAAREVVEELLDTILRRRRRHNIDVGDGDGDFSAGNALRSSEGRAEVGPSQVLEKDLPKAGVVTDAMTRLRTAPGEKPCRQRGLSSKAVSGAQGQLQVKPMDAGQQGRRCGSLTSGINAPPHRQREMSNCTNAIGADFFTPCAEMDPQSHPMSNAP